MRRLLWIVLSLGCLRTGLAQPEFSDERGDPSCARQGAMSFLCGIEAAEDAVAIPGTRLLLAGGMGFGSPATIKLIDTRTGSVTSVYPDARIDRLDRHRYPDCPGPADAARFSSVGVALQRVSRHRHRFYVVQDGGRHSIEIFEIYSRKSIPEMEWVGCVLMPEGTNANAVTPLRGHDFAVVSMDAGDPERMARHIAGEPVGSVFEWRPRTGLVRLAGPELRGGNGIAASADGRWLYVSAWSGGKIWRIDRHMHEAPLPVSPGFLPDNMHWNAHGRILVAGQLPPVSRIAQCTGNPCMAPWVVAELDPASMESRVIIESEGTADVNYATGATELDGVLYIMNRGTNRIGVVRRDEIRNDTALRPAPRR